MDIPLIRTAADTYQKLPYTYANLINAATLKYVYDRVLPEMKNQCFGKRSQHQTKFYLFEILMVEIFTNNH